MRYIINDIAFDIDPKEWPTGSTFSLMYEGDRYAREFRLNNSGMTSKSIQLIIDVITKDITQHNLLASDINWNDLLYTVNYLGLGVSVDFIYPLFLTIEDRIEWYNSCETRQTYICDYQKDLTDESKYVFGGVEEKEEELIHVHMVRMKHRDSDYDIVGKNAFSPGKRNSLPVRQGRSILKALSHIPNLFVAGGYPLAGFGYINFWSDIDIFAYGDNALEHIKEGVRICIELANTRGIEPSEINKYFPVRTQYRISVPIPSKLGEHPYFIQPIIVEFILIKSRSRYQILNRFNLDASCIGFDIATPSKFYTLPRFIRAFETKTNVTDPTRQSPSYIRRLIKYVGRGYNIAIPGFDSNNIKLSPKIMKQLTEFGMMTRDRAIKDMNLIGLQALVASALTKRNMSTKEPIVISSKNTDYEYVNTENVISIIGKVMNIDYFVGAGGSLLINDGKPINFIVGDVLNEGSRPFKIDTVIENEVEITFVPKYPIIELMDDYQQDDVIYQAKSSFYGGYYGAEQSRVQPNVLHPIQTLPSRRSLATRSIIQSRSIVSHRSRKGKQRSKLRVISKPKH